MSSPDISTHLATLFDAERTVRRAHDDLLALDPTTLAAALAREVARTTADEGADEDERALRLVRIAALLGELEGPQAVDALIDILATDEPEARHAAGEALQEIAYERFKEVALGIERALTRLPAGSPALTELPYLLAEVGEPGGTRLLGRFLGLADGEAVAAAIEALVEMGDPTAAALLAPLEKDTRQVQLDDEEGDDGLVTIGELATEARELLEEPEEPAGGGRTGRGGGR